MIIVLFMIQAFDYQLHVMVYPVTGFPVSSMKRAQNSLMPGLFMVTP